GFNDLVRDLGLSKSKAELLAWKLLQDDTKQTFFRNRQEEFEDFFSKEKDIVFCNDVENLYQSLGVEHKSEDWRLFIDSSKTSLKGVLLHNGNIYPSIPLAHEVGMKENYKNMKLLLSAIKSDNYRELVNEVIENYKIMGWARSTAENPIHIHFGRFEISTNK
ncbi:hypothetical protein L9F63_014477, partial [Diploptera punctata]